MNTFAKLGYGMAVCASAALFVAAATGLIKLDLLEVLGFVTGAWMVWLVIKENIWNWPIGIANAVLFAVVFGRARLFADAGLQVLYIALGFVGWYAWLRGGENGTELRISRTTKLGWLGLLSAGAVVLMVLRWVLIEVNGAAPLADALTSTLSLIAVYMLARKRLEHWAVWIAADIIYVWLYWTRELPLTSVLYSIFMIMCVRGWIEWHRSCREVVRGGPSFEPTYP